MRVIPLQHGGFLPSLAWLVRGALAAAACALLCSLAQPAFAAGGTPEGTVTARPPLEVLPTAPATRARLARARQCDTLARSKRLHGHKRQAFIRTCMAPRQAAAGPSR